jgi:hypothetical protein
VTAVQLNLSTTTSTSARALKHRHTVVAAVSDAGAVNENTNKRETDSAAADTALEVWLEMWNTSSEIARRICTDDFRIHFLNSEPDGSNPGDDVLGAEAFAQFLDRWRERHPTVVFSEIARSVDGAHGRMLWNVQAGTSASGGIDVFDFAENGLIREVWSVGGTREHRA